MLLTEIREYAPQMKVHAMRLNVTAISLTVAVIACDGRVTDTDANGVTNNARVSEAASGAPEKHVASSLPSAKTTENVDLSVFVGKYPKEVMGKRDLVLGTAFNDHPAVKRAVAKAAGDVRVTKFILDPPGPINPIVMQRGFLISGACEAHNCDGQNATLVITANAASAQICYYNRDRASQAAWYMDGRLVRHTAHCPGYDGSGVVRLGSDFSMRPATVPSRTTWGLTPIQRTLEGPGCALYTDRQRRVLVGEGEFSDSRTWKIGLNGISRQFRAVASTHSMEGLVSKDGSITINITKQHTIQESSDPNHPFDLSRVSVNITSANRTRTTPAYMFCGADQDYAA